MLANRRAKLLPRWGAARRARRCRGRGRMKRRPKGSSRGSEVGPLWVAYGEAKAIDYDSRVLLLRPISLFSPDRLSAGPAILLSGCQGS
jgi:hypothetical protein